MRARRILVTGADGFLGQGLIAELASRHNTDAVVATDVREVPQARRLPGITYRVLDVRDSGLGALLAEHRIDSVVHLASIVTPSNIRWTWAAPAMCSTPVWPRA